MSLQLPKILKKSYPVQIEGVLIIIIGLIIVANTTFTDINFHDKYVLPAISTCFPENQDDFCKTIRLEHGLESDAQLEIGDAYWNELARQAVMIGLIMFAVRMSIAYMIQKAGIRRIRASTFFIAIMWGIVGSGFFLFGFLDLFYFWFQGEDAPTELLWLESAGIFQDTKQFTGDPNIVEVEDLYLTNILGLAVIGSFWFITMIIYSESGLANKGIA